jgi:signal transduction histidine kinase
LDVSAAEAGVLALQFEKVSLDGVAREVLETFEPVAMDRGLRLESVIPCGIDLEADRVRIFQVLANLVDNAIKHTPRDGWVRLSIEVDRYGKGAMVSIADSGFGIAQRDLPHIFERYYRGDDSRSGPGAGLGLPLVQGIVEAHGGIVTVESEMGKGTTFRILLPYNQ